MKTSILTLCAVIILVSLALGQAPAPVAPASTASTASTNDKYVVNTQWAQVPADLPWNAATSGIAPDGKGNVLVFVRGMPFFRLFTTEGKFVRSWGDAALFTQPHSLMFDREGFVWTTDTTGHVVYKFDANGKVLLTLGKKGMPGDNASQELFNQPSALAIAANGDIYVSDGYVNSRVVHFNKDGKFIRIIGGTKGAGPGQLQLPHGVAIDSAGRILVGDSDNKRIAVFDKDGKFVENWPFASRGGMVITADDTLYVSDVNTGVMVVKNGKLIDTIGGIGRPHGLGVDKDGTIYTADATNRAVIKISPKK
jgi:sugar lactone lactonase YvrE